MAPTTYGSDTLRLLRHIAESVTDETLSEPRKFDRIPRRFKVVYPTPNTLKEAYLANISTGGVFIKTDNPLASRSTFTLKITLPDGEKELQIFCEVIWSRMEEWGTPDRKFPPGMGIKFLDLSAEGKERIDRILRQSRDEKNY